MNKELANFTIDTEDESLEIPVLRKLYRRDVLENITRAEFVEILRTEKLLDVEKIRQRLQGYSCIEEENCISLLTMLEFFDVDYLDLMQRRLRNIGVTRYSLITLFESILFPKEFSDDLSIIQEISADERFITLWNKIEYIVPSFQHLLDIFKLTLDMFYKEINEDEFIEVVVGDELYCPERILRFENFNS